MDFYIKLNEQVEDSFVQVSGVDTAIISNNDLLTFGLHDNTRNILLAFVILLA